MSKANTAAYLAARSVGTAEARAEAAERRAVEAEAKLAALAAATPPPVAPSAPAQLPPAPPQPPTLRERLHELRAQGRVLEATQFAIAHGAEILSEIGGAK
jgi:hypothetical protein